MDAKLTKQLKDIRNLLIKLDATTDQIGKVLGVKGNAISMMVPLRKNKKRKKAGP